MSQTKNPTVVDLSLNVIFLWLFVFLALVLSTIALIQGSRATEKASDAVNTSDLASTLRNYVLHSELENTLKPYIQNQDNIQIKGTHKCNKKGTCGEPDQDACKAKLTCNFAIKGPDDNNVYATFQEGGGSGTFLMIIKEQNEDQD